MALYSENNDWQRFARQKLQNSAQNLQQKQAGLEAAQNQKQKTTLESALSGLVGGLKERGSDIFNTAKNIAKYAVGQINQFGADKAIDKAQKDDSARRNEIAKKYGFGSYSEAINSGKVGDDFWNEIKSNNEKTKEKIEQNNARQGSFGDVTKINTNEAKGQALNTIDSVLGLLPGGAGAAANVLGGGLSGVGDEYKAAARENRDIDWTNARNNALVGAASGVAGMAGGNALGNAASRLGGNALGKLAGSQLAKGIAGGAAAGAVGGGLGTALNGGSLEDALLAAKEGAKAGGIGGGVMAGAMGLGGTALDKIRNRGGNISTPDVEPMEAMTVQKNRIDQPTAQRIEAEAPSTRRGIAITDLDAGEQAINVRNGIPTESRGRYIDSVVRRSDANLPEARIATADGLSMPISNGAPTAVLEASPARSIDIESVLSQMQDVPVENLTTNYQRSTIPARQYEQEIRNIPEANTTTNTAIATAPEAQIVPQVESGKATGWGGKNMEGAGKKSNILQKAGKTLQETGQATKDNQVYSKLKGNFAEEMAKKQSVERLRELGFSPSEYKKAANDSEVINKYYDDAVKATKTPVEAPQLRNIANEIADDFRLSAENRADLEKLLGTMLDDAVTHDGKMSEYTMDRYTPADLEKIAKKLGTMEQNLTTTSHGGSKKQNRNLRPEVEEYANALGEARNRLRNEIVEMTDYNEPELIARMKNAGMTQKQIDYVTQDHTLRGIKSRTSLFEDARNMDQQMRSDSLKRGANSSNSTNITTQIANESGASGLVKTIAQIPAQAIGTAEKAVGKALSWAGDKVAGIQTENTGEAIGRAAGAAKNLAGKAANLVNDATSKLNNESLSGIEIGNRIGKTQSKIIPETTTLGNVVQNAANRQIGYGQARDAMERQNNAQAISQAQSDYDNALADYQAQEATYNNQMAQLQSQNANSQLDRIANAMEMALNAGDITAYGQLADLYTQAAKIEELRNPTAATADLSAAQQKELNKLDSAANAIDMLEQLYTNAGGAKGIVGGNLANLMGNIGLNSDVATYNDLSQGLINQISAAVGKTDALNNQGEVQAALKLIPKMTDSATTAQNKLARLREILQTNRESMLSNYGA